MSEDQQLELFPDTKKPPVYGGCNHELLDYGVYTLEGYKLIGKICRPCKKYWEVDSLLPTDDIPIFAREMFGK